MVGEYDLHHGVLGKIGKLAWSEANGIKGWFKMHSAVTFVLTPFRWKIIENFD